MINIVFVPGTFGTTVEYVLRSHTVQGTPVDTKIASDGSMHTVNKLAHFTHPATIKHFFQSDYDPNTITTPIYGFAEVTLDQILTVFKGNLTPADKNILIYCPDFRWAEINILFNYYKVAIGTEFCKGLQIFDDRSSPVFKNYDTFRAWQSQPLWQWRNWFSEYYPNWVSPWISSVNEVPESFLTISNQEILLNPAQSLEKIIKHCDLDSKYSLNNFATEWQDKQQYVLQSYQTICTIRDCIVDNQYFEYESLNIVSEAILKHKLKDSGFVLNADGLNALPLNTVELRKLLSLI